MARLVHGSFGVFVDSSFDVVILCGLCSLILGFGNLKRFVLSHLLGHFVVELADLRM